MLNYWLLRWPTVVSFCYFDHVSLDIVDNNWSTMKPIRIPKFGLFSTWAYASISSPGWASIVKSRCFCSSQGANTVKVSNAEILDGLNYEMFRTIIPLILVLGGCFAFLHLLEWKNVALLISTLSFLVCAIIIPIFFNLCVLTRLKLQQWQRHAKVKSIC